MKLKYPLVKGEVRQLYPGIFAVIIKDDYDRALLFSCYQEFYESPFKEIRGKFFRLEDLMRIYIKKNKKDFFTYHRDWSGYNIPSHIIKKRFDNTDIQNDYDWIMWDIVKHCDVENLGNPFYLIGVDKIKSTTMDHEIAHGLFYTNKEYRNECQVLVDRITRIDYKFIMGKLLELGYVKDKIIIDDEIQAFMSTGLYRTFNKPFIRKYVKDFEKNFKKYK